MTHQVPESNPRFICLLLCKPSFIALQERNIYATVRRLAAALLRAARRFGARGAEDRRRLVLRRRAALRFDLRLERLRLPEDPAPAERLLLLARRLAFLGAFGTAAERRLAARRFVALRERRFADLGVELRRRELLLDLERERDMRLLLREDEEERRFFLGFI